MGNQKLKADVERKYKGMLCYSSTETAMLDLDNMTLNTAKSTAFKILAEFRLEGFLVLESSRNHFHIVYDRTIQSFFGILKVIAWAYKFTKNPSIAEWLANQIIKGYCTLRLGKRGKVSAPKIVFRYGKQNCKIKNYLQLRREALIAEKEEK